MEKQVIFQARELADVYALKTLYDCVRGSLGDADLFFRGSVDDARSKEVLQGCKTQEESYGYSIDSSVRREGGLVITPVSDIGSYAGGSATLQVDITLLKNMAVPLSLEEKRMLRARYGVPQDRRVVVIGYASGTAQERDIIHSLPKDVTVCLVGNGNPRLLETDRDVRVVKKQGVLKDFYAMADAALNAHNLSASQSPLHNFVEATEGGPLFMIPSTNSAQYGYRELCRRGVVREGLTLDNIVEQLNAYLSNPNRAEVTEKRRGHLEATRSRYVPVIVAYSHVLLGDSTSQIPQSDLKVTREGRGQVVMLMHPETSWGLGVSSFKFKDYSSPLVGPMFELPKLLKRRSELEKFQFEKLDLEKYKDYPFKYEDYYIPKNFEEIIKNICSKDKKPLKNYSFEGESVSW